MRTERGKTTYYTYDASGRRVRKVTERAGGSRKHETLYLGGVEIFRRYDGVGATVFQRESLHVMDDKCRIARVETTTVDHIKPSPRSADFVIRYQLADQLGSSCVELDEHLRLISLEEYHPYGTTSHQAGRSVAEVGLKRYRYTGKERDEETGLYYYGARFSRRGWASGRAAIRQRAASRQTHMFMQPITRSS